MDNCRFIYSKPPKSLQSAVRGFWLMSGEGRVDEFINTKIVPCSGFGIISTIKGNFFYKDDEDSFRRYPKSFAIGVRSKDYEVKILGSYELFGIIFQPEVYHSLHLTSARELFDNRVSLHDIFGSTAHLFEEELHLGATFQDKIRIASRYLENHFLKNRRSPDKRIELLMKDIHSDLYMKSVPEIAGMCNMSPRNFNRKFIDAMGVGPKKYNRIIRFQKIINLFSSNKTNLNLTALAYEFGYADQSHFIRDFADFSGITPLAFLNDRIKQPKRGLVQEITLKMKTVELIHV